MIVKDQLCRKLHINNPPKRIISLVPSLTELIVDLGLEDQLVGITKFCVHPRHIKASKTIVGGTKQIHIEKIKALQPDIILCNKEENTKEMIEGLLDIAPIHISDVDTLEACFELMEMYGDIFDVKQKSNHLIHTINTERQSFKEYVKDKPSKRIVYFIWKDPWMVAASSTFIDTMIKEAGFQNCYAKQERYPEISLDADVLKEADEIFLSSEPYPFKEKHVKELRIKFPYKKIRIVDGELFSWYGSRLQKSFSYFKTLHKPMKP